MIMSPLHSLHINTRMHILIAVFYIQGHTNRKIPWRGNVSQYNAVYVQSHIQLWYLRQGQGREAAQVFPTSHHWLFMSRFFLNIQLSCVKYFFLMVPLGLTMVPMSSRDVFFHLLLTVPVKEMYILCMSCLHFPSEYGGVKVSGKNDNESIFTHWGSTSFCYTHVMLFKG